MDISFVGKRVLVTGAGKGIGREIALALARGGAITYSLSRTQSDLDLLKQEHENIRIICQDITDWDATGKALTEIGAIDLLVNNAAIIDPVYGQFGRVTSQSFDNMMNINLKAAINISQTVAKGMIERKSGGAIVNISSIASERSAPNYFLYSCSKAALDMATKAMAFELGPHQIRVNSVNPTAVLTEMGKKIPEELKNAVTSRTPQRKFAEIDDVVNATLYLLSDKSDMINGALLPVDGGYLTH